MADFFLYVYITFVVRCLSGRGECSKCTEQQPVVYRCIVLFGTLIANVLFIEINLFFCNLLFVVTILSIICNVVSFFLIIFAT